MTEKTLTTENIKPALDALRGELAPWPVMAMKQDRLNDTQKSAVNSGITSSLVAQIIANTAAIRALESAITGTGLRALVVTSLPAIGTQGILYIVPVTTYDPATDADVVNYSNEYIWIVAPDAPVTEGYYEQVGQTGIVINNGQLTITVNGTSVGTFTANQSGDTTAAITVPTNADYVDKTTAQSIAGVKTFSDGIVSNVTGNVTGDLTGTASKAIADEDGTSIKTGYVNVAGNQTVSGQKDWSSLQTFSYGQIRIKSLSQEIGVTPSTGVIQYLEFADKNNVQHGKVGLWDYDNGASEIQMSISDKYKNGAKDSTGTSDTAFLSFGFQYNGTKFLTFSGQVNNSIIPLATNTYALGSSSYQWSSVYAQTYYYNGTAWGLDKANVWTNANHFTGGNYNNSVMLVNSTLDLSQGNPSVAETNQSMICLTDSSKQRSYSRFQSWTASNQTVTVLGSTYKPDANSEIDFSVWISNKPNDTTFHPYGVASPNLGNSTYKWKTLNGINPGALSLPNSPGGSGTVNVNYIDISGDIITRDGSSANSYTVVCDGWISINSFATWIQIANDTTTLCTTVLPGSDGFAQAFLPVRQGDSLRIVIIQTGTQYQSFKLIPCQGNV